MGTDQFELHFGSIPLGDAILSGRIPDSSPVTLPVPRNAYEIAGGSMERIT